MTNAIWLAARAAALAAALAVSSTAAGAHGALAVGACGSWGGGWSFDTEDAARERALRECRGRNCRIVTTFSGLCAAFAYDRSRDCGAIGWATRATRAEAERDAIRQCEAAGGRECHIRGQFCD